MDPEFAKGVVELPIFSATILVFILHISHMAMLSN